MTTPPDYTSVIKALTQVADLLDPPVKETALQAAFDLKIMEYPSPLKYDAASGVQRIALVDPSVGDPKKFDTYFAGKQRTLSKTTRKPLKKPVQEIEPAGDGVVAFLDWTFWGGEDGVYIHYINTRSDHRGKRHAQRLLDHLYEKHKGVTIIHWGKVMNAVAWMLLQQYQDLEAEGYPRTSGKNYSAAVSASVISPFWLRSESDGEPSDPGLPYGGGLLENDLPYLVMQDIDYHIETSNEEGNTPIDFGEDEKFVTSELEVDDLSSEIRALALKFEKKFWETCVAAIRRYPLEGETVKQAIHALFDWFSFGDSAYFAFQHFTGNGVNITDSGKDLTIESFEMGDLVESFTKEEDEGVQAIVHALENAIYKEAQHIADQYNKNAKPAPRGPDVDTVVYKYAGTNDTIAGASAKGMYVAELMTAAELSGESRELGHCLGNRRHGHPQLLEEGKTRVFSIRTPVGKSKFSIEISKQTERILEVKGKGNRLPGEGGKDLKKDELLLVTEFFTQYLKKSPDELRTGDLYKVNELEATGYDPFSPPPKKKRNEQIAAVLRIMAKVLTSGKSKGEPFIGPKGGKYRDEALTIPWPAEGSADSYEGQHMNLDGHPVVVHVVRPKVHRREGKGWSSTPQKPGAQKHYQVYLADHAPITKGRKPAYSHLSDPQPTKKLALEQASRMLRNKEEIEEENTSKVTSSFSRNERRFLTSLLEAELAGVEWRFMDENERLAARVLVKKGYASRGKSEAGTAVYHITPEGKEALQVNEA